jgi:protein SCO1
MTRVAALFIVAVLAVFPAAAESALTPSQLADLSFRQHPGSKLPLDAMFVDEAGHPVRLGDFFAGRPVILVLDYLRCRTLCGLVLGNLAKTLDHVPLTAGRDFKVVAASIDPSETPDDSRAARVRYLAGNAAPGTGWHFLTGRKDALERLADAVGFPYREDAATHQFAHPAGLTVAAPDGTIARYVLGIDYVPLDLRLALTEAGKGVISSPVANLLLLCYHYNPSNGRYDLPIANTMRIAGGLTLLGIIAMIAMLSRSRKGH